MGVYSDIADRELTFSDVSLLPQYSEVLPSEADPSTHLSDTIHLKTPFLSAAMDTVTESAMGIGLAQLGGLGIVHKNMSIASQAEQVRLVKTARVSNEHAQDAALDESGRLLCGAAVSPGPELEDRALALKAIGLDVFVLDTAHGHSKGVIDGVKWLRNQWPDTYIIAGNIVTAEAAVALYEAGANAVKVGIGPGSICTTRMVAGVGLPQLSAIRNVRKITSECDLKLIADGGIQFSGDVVKALAAGADAIMMGSLFAGTDESPGERAILGGRSFKTYRGMGSLGAMAQGSNDRYGQGKEKNARKFVPEGVEGRIPYVGPLSQVVYQLIGGLRAGMGYLGAGDLMELKKRAKFVRVTSAGLKESHVHDVDITKEAPNYHTH